jgi:hypothetical protein
MYVLGLKTFFFVKKPPTNTTDKGLLVLIDQPKIPQMHQNVSAQFVYPSQKVWDIIVKNLYWASVVRDFKEYLLIIKLTEITVVGKLFSIKTLKKKAK